MKKAREQLERLIAFYSKEPKQTTINEYVANDLDEVLDEIKKEEPSVPIDENFESMMISALRYALGRKSYIVGLTIDYLTPLLPSLSDGALTVMECDITEHMRYIVTHEFIEICANGYPHGVSPIKSDTDEEWFRLRGILRREIYQRKKMAENG